MGRKAFFTKDEIFKAADELALQGEDVAVRTLHAYLGGGSFSSVMKYLTLWKQERPVEDSNSAKVDMPVSMVNAFDAVWKSAMAQAFKELAGEREKAALAVQEADMRASEALAAIEELENANNEQAEKLDELTKKLEAVEQQLQKALSESSAVSAVNQELKDQEQKLQNKLERAAQERDTAIKEAAELKGRSDSLSSQNDKLLAKLSDREEKKVKG